MRKLVYIVDDQPSVLQSVVLLLEGLDPEWRVVGFTDPFKALAAVKAQAPDMVFSDHRMPGLPGSKLLEEVRLTAPKAVRVIMSGYVDVQALSLVVSAHQYIAKPFDALQLRELIGRALTAQARMEHEGLREIVGSLRSLPSLPHVYYSLLRALGDENSSIEEIAQLVDTDAGLSSKLLQLANSSLFGHGSLVSSPDEAVLCLGTGMIKAVVLSQELFKRYSQLRSPELDVSRLWNHCWQVAYLVQRICSEQELTQAQAEEAFLAGILHESGKLILLENFPEQFQVACRAARQVRSPLTPLLLQTFGATPPQLAAYLLELWGLPPSVTRAVAGQEHPGHDGGPGQFSLTTALYIADQVATRKSPPDGFVIPEWDSAGLEAVGCEPDFSIWERFGTGG